LDLSQETLGKLEVNTNIWVATVRPDGRPHLVPVWFVLHDHKIYLSIDPASVKSRNISRNPQVALALEDGSHPIICEGEAHQVLVPYPEDVIQRFSMKYGWDILTENQYNLLVEVTPRKWLSW
jgi:hypothetical protein